MIISLYNYTSVKWVMAVLFSWFYFHLVDSNSCWNLNWFHIQPCPECPPLPPTPGHLCFTPAGAQDCYYKGGNGGTDQSPFVSKCCCGRCEAEPMITCASDSTTGSGLWQPMHSPLCPAEGCGSEGEWWKIILSSSWKPQVSSPHQTTLTTILTTLTRRRQ